MFDKSKENLNFSSEDISKSEAILWAHQKKGIKILTIQDTFYLPSKKQNQNSPLVLYYKGTIQNPTANHVAIVGSRKATEYGKAATKLACHEYAAKGTIIISGLALGIDSLAHHTALCLGGVTYAFVANGLDTCYPKENAKMMANIEDRGAVISPYPAQIPPRKYHFVHRNEIMTTWADDVLVIEGGRKSGAVMTGELALKNNRNVFVVPNNIFLSTSYGSNGLLKKGADPFLLDDKTADIYHNKKNQDPILQNIIELLKVEPLLAESLSEQLERNVDQMQIDLYSLEMEGEVRFPADGKWHYIYEDVADKKEFFVYLLESRETCGFQILFYVLMDNHYHLILEAGEMPIWKGIQRLNTTYSKYYLKRGL